MMTLPNWMRSALYATAAMNIVGATMFLPPAGALRELAGMPNVDHPLYMLTTAMFVLLFGIGYLWTVLANRGDHVFITLAATGKLTFFALVLWLWTDGALPARAVLFGTGDLIFGVMFAKWLYDIQGVVPVGAPGVRVRA
jgi:hypothetical protein